MGININILKLKSRVIFLFGITRVHAQKKNIFQNYLFKNNSWVCVCDKINMNGVWLYIEISIILLHLFICVAN